MVRTVRSFASGKEINWRRVVWIGVFWYVFYTSAFAGQKPASAQPEKEKVNGKGTDVQSRPRRPAPLRLTRDDPPIRLSLMPRVCLPPCTIRYSVVIERDADNKRWSIAWGADTGHEGYHDAPHEGEGAPYQIVDYLKDLPEGYYGVMACVYRVGKTLCTETFEVQVGFFKEE